MSEAKLKPFSGDSERSTAAERLQYEGYVLRRRDHCGYLGLSESGAPFKQIVRQTGHRDVFRARQSSLDPYLPWLDDQ